MILSARNLLRVCTLLPSIWLAALAPQPAQALPAFARQTGSECTACHIAGVGPHLTPFGMQFKMSGYTDGDKDSMPLSAQLRVSYNDLKRASSSASTRLDEASVYLAGRLASRIGIYAKVTHTDDPFNSGAPRTTQLDNLDLRYADTAQAIGREMAWGLSLNNSPGVQDPLDANQAWGFPALGTTGSLFNGTTHPTVPRRVLGLTGFAQFDKHWYGELGGYRSLGRDTQDKLGQDPASDPGRFSSAAPYWRLAYLRDLKTQFLGFGFYGLSARRQLTVLSPQPLVTERSGPYDRLRDVGADAVYEYLGDRRHVVQLRANYLREQRRFGSTPTNPFTGAVAPADSSLTESTLAATYVYRQTCGATIAWLSSRASADAVRYYPNDRPDSRVRYTEVFWTPFGREDSWHAPWANLRLAANWTRFDRFNGGTTNVFGPFSPNARDLDAFQLYAQVTF
jgi:hypothetical protein